VLPVIAFGIGSVPVRLLKGRVGLIWASFADGVVHWERFGRVPE